MDFVVTLLTLLLAGGLALEQMLERGQKAALRADAADDLNTTDLTDVTQTTTQRMVVLSVSSYAFRWW